MLGGVALTIAPCRIESLRMAVMKWCAEAMMVACGGGGGVGAGGAIRGSGAGEDDVGGGFEADVCAVGGGAGVEAAGV